MKLEIENYLELLALHKSIMAVKFDTNACLPEAQGSPFTASLAFKVFDLLVSVSNSEGKTAQAENWLAWRVAGTERAETKLLMQRISDATWWPSASEQDRIKYVTEFMAPLKLNSEAQNEIFKNN